MVNQEQAQQIAMQLYPKAFPTNKVYDLSEYRLEDRLVYDTLNNGSFCGTRVIVAIGKSKIVTNEDETVDVATGRIHNTTNAVLRPQKDGEIKKHNFYTWTSFLQSYEYELVKRIELVAFIKRACAYAHKPFNESLTPRQLCCFMETYQYQDIDRSCVHNLYLSMRSISDSYRDMRNNVQKKRNSPKPEQLEEVYVVKPRIASEFAERDKKYGRVRRVLTDDDDTQAVVDEELVPHKSRRITKSNSNIDLRGSWGHRDT